MTTLERTGTPRADLRDLAFPFRGHGPKVLHGRQDGVRGGGGGTGRGTNEGGEGGEGVGLHCLVLAQVDLHAHVVGGLTGLHVTGGGVADWCGARGFLVYAHSQVGR